MKRFDDLSPATKLAHAQWAPGALDGQHPAVHQLAHQQQRREVLAERLAFAYGVTVNDVYDTASTYPWTFETFYDEALAGRVTMRKGGEPNS